MMRRVTPYNLRIPELGWYLYAIRRICLGLIFTTALSSIIAISTASARLDDVYLITNVAVDITAETAADARRQAIGLAHRKALDRLIARLVLAGQRAQILEIDQSKIDILTQSYSIEQERRSSVRYLGTLRFQFRRKEMRRFLRGLDVGFAETQSKPVLVIPVFENAGVKILWDTPNPWFSAWKRLPAADGLVPRLLPSGDLLDIRDISAEQAVAGDLDQLELVAQRYGAKVIIVAKASVVIDIASGERSLATSLNYFGEINAQARPNGYSTFSFFENEKIDGVIQRAADHLANKIAENWKKNNLIQFDKLNQLTTNLSIRSLREWTKVRGRLRRIALIKTSEVISVSNRQISLKLVFYGNPEQLQIAFAQEDLSLDKDQGRWRLGDLKKGAKNNLRLWERDDRR